MTVRVLLRHYGFAMAYLAGVIAAGLAYTLLDPDAQARLIAWTSTNVANREHEPVVRCWSPRSLRPGSSRPGRC